MKKDIIKGFVIGVLVTLVFFIVACAYKPDHRAYPQTQYGNIICDPEK